MKKNILFKSLVIAIIALTFQTSVFSQGVVISNNPGDTPDASAMLEIQSTNKGFLAPRMSTYAWSSKQCYLALSNMMTGAASLGIDSCPIEGFEKEPVEELLKIDTDKEEVAVIVTFGYRAGEQTPRLRQKLDDLVHYF